MIPRFQFQFSLSNLFLMTLVVGVVAGLVSLALRQDNTGFAVLALVFGVPASIGTLVNGVKGLKRGFFAAFLVVVVMYLVTALIIIVLTFLGVSARF